MVISGSSPWFNWTLPRLRAEIERQTGASISAPRLSTLLKRSFRWRRPRHILTGRQDALAVDRMGVRLQLRQDQADAGDIVLLCADESEALTHPYLAHAWAERGAELRVRAPGQSRKVALSGEPLGSTIGVLDAVKRELVVSTSPTKVSAEFIAFLRRLDWRCGPKPGSTRVPVALVLDNGPVHTSKASRAALAERPWITVEWLPRHSPELNAIENVWTRNR